MSYYLDGLRLTSPDPLASVRKMKEILEPLFYEEFLKYCQELASYLEEDRHLAWNEIPLFDLCSPCDDGEVLDERLRGLKTSEKQPLWLVQSFQKVLFDKSQELHDQEGLYFSPLNALYTGYIFENGNPGDNPLMLFRSSSYNPYRDALLASGLVEPYSYSSHAEPDERKEERVAWSTVTENSSPGSTFYDFGLSFSNPRSESVFWRTVETNGGFGSGRFRF